MEAHKLIKYYKRINKMKLELGNSYLSLVKSNQIEKKDREKYYFEIFFRSLEDEFLNLIIYELKDDLIDQEIKDELIDLKEKTTIQLYNEFTILYLEYKSEIKDNLELTKYKKNVENHFIMISKKFEKIM